MQTSPPSACNRHLFLIDRSDRMLMIERATQRDGATVIESVVPVLNKQPDVPPFFIIRQFINAAFPNGFTKARSLDYRTSPQIPIADSYHLYFLDATIAKEQVKGLTDSMRGDTPPCQIPEGFLRFALLDRDDMEQQLSVFSPTETEPDEE